MRLHIDHSTVYQYAEPTRRVIQLLRDDGVQVLEIDGRRTVGHSGRLLGFRSAVRYLPDQGVSIAVLTNQSRTDPGPIVRSLLRLALTPLDDPCRCRVRR